MRYLSDAAPSIAKQFAYLQLSTVIVSVIRNLELKLGAEGFPSPDYTVSAVLPFLRV